VLCSYIDIILSTSTSSSIFFFFTYPPPTEIYTLSLHDALPILNNKYELGIREDERVRRRRDAHNVVLEVLTATGVVGAIPFFTRSEEHTSELQSRRDLVCRLLLEKKKKETARKIRIISSDHFSS